ncbi:MAG: hypothetical protein ISS93_03005 [Candidatus Aenigmarchaeota archaeon]|nr:hypothetical protein [Candidatus Aenigmarchaeota archaeon]
MKALIVLLLVIGLLLTTAISGCTTQNEINSSEEAQKTLQDVSKDVDDLGKTLGEIEQSLG